MLSTDASLKSSPVMAQPMFSRVWGFDEITGFLQEGLLPQRKVSQATEELKGKKKKGKVAALHFARGFCSGIWSWFLQSGERTGMPLGNVIFTSACFSENQINREAQKTFLRKKYCLQYARIRTARGFGAQQGSQALFDFRTYGWNASCTYMQTHTSTYAHMHECMYLRPCITRLFSQSRQEKVIFVAEEDKEAKGRWWGSSTYLPNTSQETCAVQYRKQNKQKTKQVKINQAVWLAQYPVAAVRTDAILSPLPILHLSRSQVL